LTFTQPAYYGNRNALPVTGLSPVNRYDPLDLGGTVRIPVTRKFNLLFDRITEGTVNQPLECVLQAGSPAPGAPAGRVCANDSRDIILQYHGTYAFDRFLTLDVGDSFRHRIWNNGASGVSTVPFLCNNNGRSTGPNCTVSSTEHHFGYAGLFEEALRMDSVDALVARFGTGVETAESVPTAFGVANISQGDAWEACARAAELGGDTDTMAALAGAMVGATTGLSALPVSAVRMVRDVNELDFEPLVDGLLALRRR